MLTIINKYRWIVALLIISIVVAASAIIILASSDTSGNLSAKTISDGSGGAIIAWQNKEGIYAQHINSSGEPLWDKGGLCVKKITTQINRNAFPGYSFFSLIPDGTGGAILSWQDRHTFPGPVNAPPVDTYSQRISTDGKLLWHDGIVTGKVSPIDDKGFEIVSDGLGGAIFGWNDYETDYRALSADFFRVQKISPDGEYLWGDKGALVIASSPWRPITDEDKALGIQGTISRSWPTYTGYQAVAGDGEQGAIVMWHVEDYPRKMHYIYAQRIDSQGNFVWPGPIELNTSGGFPYYSVVTSAAQENDGLVTLLITRADLSPLTTLLCFDRNGEIVWRNYLPSSTQVVTGKQGEIYSTRYENVPQYSPPEQRSTNVYVQRLDEKGKELWADSPVIRTGKGQSIEANIAGDGSGGAIVVWRIGQTYETAFGELLAQRLNAEGNVAWDTNGVGVFGVAKFKHQGSPEVASTESGAIVIAVVGRNATRGDMVYAQKLGMDGRLLWDNGIRIDR